MPVYEVSIQKEFEAYKWVNTYRVSAASLSVAHSSYPHFVTFEKAYLTQHARFVKAHTHAVATADPNDFTSTDLNEFGSNNADRALLSPAFVTLFVKFSAATGRPGKKFLRYSIYDSQYEGAGEGATITATGMFAQVAASVSALLSAVDPIAVVPLIGASNREIVSGSLGGLAMCQTRHGWYNRASNP